MKSDVMVKNSVWRGLFLRTREVVIKQSFDNVRGEIEMDTVVLLTAGHLPIETVSRHSKA